MNILSVWAAVERSMKIPWDLEGASLQIKTDSTVGSGEWIWVVMYDKDGNSINGMGRNRPNQEILLPDWLITSHVA